MQMLFVIWFCSVSCLWFNENSKSEWIYWSRIESLSCYIQFWWSMVTWFNVCNSIVISNFVENMGVPQATAIWVRLSRSFKVCQSLWEAFSSCHIWQVLIQKHNIFICFLDTFITWIREGSKWLAYQNDIYIVWKLEKLSLSWQRRFLILSSKCKDQTKSVNTYPVIT